MSDRRTDGPTKGRTDGPGGRRGLPTSDASWTEVKEGGVGGVAC